MTKKLSFKAETVRNLTADQLQSVAGGSISIVDPGGPRMTIGTSGTSVISMTPGTSVISRNPSGGSH